MTAMTIPSDEAILESVANHLARCPRDEPLDPAAVVMLRQVFERLDEFTGALRAMAVAVGGTDG